MGDENFKHVEAVLRDDQELPEIPNLSEIDVKLLKINTILNSVDKRIKAHQRGLRNLMNMDEKENTRNKIAKLTQNILENS